MLFDTHLHLIYPNRLRYPWLNDVPALNKPYQYEDYERDAARSVSLGPCIWKSTWLQRISKLKQIW